MLRKLVKHDILSTYRDFAGLYLGMFALAILVGTSMINDTSGYVIGFSLAGFIAITITSAVVTLVSIIRLFSRRMFSTEGYLTLTLPATNTQTVIAKLLSGAFWSIMTTAMISIAIGIMFMTSFVIFIWSQYSLADIIIDGQSLLQIWTALLETGIIKDVVLGFLTGIPMGILEMFYSLLILLFVIVLVNTSFVKKSKTLIGIVAFFVINMILNNFRTNFIAGPISLNDLNIQILPGMNGVNQVLAALRGFEYEINWLQYGGLALFYVLTIASFGYLTVWLLNKKLELE
jgi:hypothetical protein